MGGLIALFERAVGLYASLVGINAYHQPGVEAGKKQPSAILAVRKAVIDHLKATKELHRQQPRSHKQSDNLKRIHGFLKFLKI